MKMKNLLKLLGIIALIAVIGFSMAGCKGEEEEEGIDLTSGDSTKQQTIKVEILNTSGTVSNLSYQKDITHVKILDSYLVLVGKGDAKLLIDEDASISKDSGKKEFTITTTTYRGLDEDYVCLDIYITFGDGTSNYMDCGSSIRDGKLELEFTGYKFQSN
jgi:hypothetical protein